MNTEALAMLSGAAMAFMVCIFGYLLRRHESCDPIVQGEPCGHCGTYGKLYKGACTDCWMAIIQGLERCDDCGRLWEPAHDDSRDICPRCRVLKVGIVPPEDMTETEKMRKRVI